MLPRNVYLPYMSSGCIVSIINFDPYDLTKYRSMSLTLILPLFLSCKCCLLITPVVYILVHLRLDFFMEADNMDLDQTAPLGAFSSGFILFAI